MRADAGGGNADRGKEEGALLTERAQAERAQAEQAQAERADAAAEGEAEADRALIAAARQRVSIPVLATGQQQQEQQLLGGAIKVGMGCDVEQSDEGLDGARFSAEVRQLWPLSKAGKKKAATQALVVYDTLFDEVSGAGGSGSDAKRLQEWVPISALHPVPPPAPDDWITHVRPGDELEGLYQGGWWTVVVAAQGDSPSTFVTEVQGYDGLQRTFCGADLRPPVGSRLLDHSLTVSVTQGEKKGTTVD